MKVYKLIRHQKTQQKNYAGEEIAFCPKDFPFISENDIVEIFNQDENSPSLLLMVAKGSLRDDFTPKDSLSIEQSIANLFQLKSYSDVVVRKVAVEDVELDSLELTFKDQYLGRSEMWRLKNSLVDTCLHLNKKIEFASASIRCQVYEMWSHGDKVASGVFTSTTKIVFRSSTSMVYLFIQMSSEMWEFDIYGDLYFEKAVNGFVSDLFAKWKENGSNHEVTIVLFSRLYYEAYSTDQFPESVRDCLQIDYKGRIYEDYYRVAVQNERFDDWGSTLLHLKHIFVDYQSYLLNVHVKENPSWKMPRSLISSAAQGNFLEVLNMSLNVFEKHYLDRSFDRTGQLSVVITPGVGVFEVDRDLTNVTMQRIIDNGVGSDLVCVGEQPLHAVPLLKFNNKATSQNNVEDYSMPHWINLSFYSTNKKVGYSTYTPRIKFPMNSSQPSILAPKYWEGEINVRSRIPKSHQSDNENSWPNSNYDFDDYDNKIFQPAHSGTLPRRQRKKLSSYTDINNKKTFRRQNSEPEIHQTNLDFTSLANSTLSISSDKSISNSSGTLNTSAAISIPAKRFVNRLDHHTYSSSFGTLNTEGKSKLGSKYKWHYDDLCTQGGRKTISPCSSSHGGSPKDEMTYSRRRKDTRLPSRALINPFDPSHAVIKLTSNRRRWTHIFPRGPSGALIQQHHFHSSYPKLAIVHEGLDSFEDGSSSPATESLNRSGRNSVTRQASDGNLGRRMLTLLWGATGEQEWTPAMQTGVDWKSLTIPACLPITTDYFPDERSLQIDYLVSDYSLLPDDVNADYAQQRAVYRRPLTTREVFQELVSQRLAQGFQLIVGPNTKKSNRSSSNPTMNPACIGNIFGNESSSEEYCLSIGRVFHKIRLDGSTITVTRYRPRHPYPSIEIRYQYRFHAPNNHNYELSWAEFSTEKLENYNWNYLDHYICTRGDRDFALVESLKYWRFRMLLLPTFQMATKKLTDGSSTNTYTPLTNEECSSLTEGFLKFIETCINRIRRPINSPRKFRGSGNQQNSQSGPVFRERVGSNRLSERPRARSGSKSERRVSGKVDGSGRVSPADGDKVTHSLGGLQTDGSQDYSHPNNSLEDGVFEFRLNAKTSLADIAQAMCSQNNGFSFIKSVDLPEYTFVSFDAVAWLIAHLEGVTSEVEAVEKFNEMLKNRLISHASGDAHHPFINGFYLYYILSRAQDGTLYLKQHEDLDMFQNEWMEVEIKSERQAEADISSIITSPLSVSLDLNRFDFSKADVGAMKRELSGTPFKDVYLDVDSSKKSDRQEWGHVRYQTSYKPDEAFELAVHWVQATGSIITELALGWSRKAQQCNMQLVPIPSDPFALPCSVKSDSLRGPIFIPLDINTLLENKDCSIEVFDHDSWKKNLIVLQDYIVMHFGFIRSSRPCTHVKEHTNRDGFMNDRYYVHSSGNMFVLIKCNSTRQEVLPRGSPEKSTEKSITRMSFPVSATDEHPAPLNIKPKFPSSEEKIGFLWSWNYMVSKRWKTSSTPSLGDDAYMMKVLKDFQAFCGNQNNRLNQFWESRDNLNRPVENSTA